MITLCKVLSLVGLQRIPPTDPRVVALDDHLVVVDGLSGQVRELQERLDIVSTYAVDLRKAVGKVARWDDNIGNAHHPFCNFQPTKAVLLHNGTSCNCGIVNCHVAYNMEVPVEVAQQEEQRDHVIKQQTMEMFHKLGQVDPSLGRVGSNDSSGV